MATDSTFLLHIATMQFKTTLLYDNNCRYNNPIQPMILIGRIDAFPKGISLKFHCDAECYYYLGSYLLIKYICLKIIRIRQDRVQ